MSRNVPLSAAPPLTDLVANMAPGDQVVFTTDGQPVAVLARPPLTSWPCQPGTANDRKLWMASDFNDPLDDFAEYG